MALSKINVRSPFYLLADPNTTTTTSTTTTLAPPTTGAPTTSAPTTAAPTTTLAPTTSAGCTAGGITVTNIPNQTLDYSVGYLALNLATYFSSSGTLSYTINILGDTSLVQASEIGGYLTLSANTSGNCGDVNVQIIASDDANSCEEEEYFKLTINNCPTTTLAPSTTQPEPAIINLHSMLTQSVGENPSYEIEFSYTTLINNVPTVRTRTHTLPVPANGDYDLKTPVSVISNVTATVSRISPDNTVADSTTIDFSRNTGSYEQRSSFNTTDVVENVSYTFTGVVTDDTLYVDITEG